MAEDLDNLNALLQRIRDGDEEALARLLQCYEAQLRLAARVLLGPKLRAKMDSLDLIQSVHRVLLPGIREARYDVSSLDKLLALARTVLRHKIIRNWRRQQREQEAETAKVVGQERGSARRALAEEPSHSVAAADLQQHILAGLSGVERQLVELRLEGYSTVEIA